MTDDTTRGFITRRLSGDRETLLRDARYIADSWDQYVAALERDPGATTRAEPVRLAEHTARLIQTATWLDASRDMARILMEDER